MITSPQNERIKAIRKLQDRKSRQESGQFFVEGIRIVGQALESGAQVECLLVSPDLLRSEQAWEWIGQARERGIEVLETNADVFERLSSKEGPQGLAAVVRQRWDDLAEIQPQQGRPWVALESVADPGNLGTILRTSDAAGGAGVILIDQSTDPFDPSAVRASMGAIFSQRLVKTSGLQFLEWKHSTGCFMVGTSDAAAQDYHAMRYPDPLVVLMGSERQGLSQDLLRACDAVVSIPMLGKSDSLNLAVATAVILYETLNQRRDRE